MNKGINDNPPRICQTEMEGDSTSCQVNRACVNFPSQLYFGIVGICACFSFQQS